MAIYQNSETESIGTPKDSLLVSLATGSGNYWFSFVSDPLTVVFFLFWEAIFLRSYILVLGLSFGAGLMSFSLAEYAFHRWVYHKGRTPAHVGHKKHHESPEALIAMPGFIVTPLIPTLCSVLPYTFHLPFIPRLLSPSL